MTKPNTIPVLAASHLDPGTRRIEMEVLEGLSVAEIVKVALPTLPEADLAQVRVTLVTAKGAMVLYRSMWAQLRPKPGVRVVIRLIAGKGALKAVLSIVVAVAAIAIGAYFAPALAGTFGLGASAWSGLVAAGVSLVGNMLINALIPPVKPEDREAQNRYTISGFRNRAEPNGAVPILMGTVRYAPPFGALSYTEIVGDWQYIRAMFALGEGRIQIDDIKIGETSISDYTSVEVETREGVEGDTVLSLFPQQIAEEAISVELTRPLRRDERGELVEVSYETDWDPAWGSWEEFIADYPDGYFDPPEETEGGITTVKKHTVNPSIETPVVRTTGADASGASVILAFPSGMIRINDEGESRSESVSVLIEQRPVDGEEWQEVTTLKISGKKLEAFFRQHTWEFPSRGRWQVRLTMLTAESTKNSVQRRTSWAALQTLRPEYPLAYPRPLALVAVRIKATHQLSGALDNLSVIGKRICPDWDAATGTWIERATSNPASLYRYALQSPANPKAVSDVGIDLDQLQDWHAFCSENGLSFNKVFDEAGTSLRDVLTEITAAGRATPRHDGVKWGVTVDWPQDLIVDHLDPQNSSGFRATRSYIAHPHAFRVRFQDETNNYEDAERVVRWPGYEGEITLTEALDLPGITDPAIIWREARRRQYEAIYRCDAYQATQDGPIRVATRGDKVVLSHYVLDSVQASARVLDVIGQMIELDQSVLMEDGQDYVIRFRTFEDRPDGQEPDTIGTSIIRQLRTVAGETTALILKGDGVVPQGGDVILFGRASSESLPMIVRGIERGEENAEILHMVDEAPEIDQLLAADEIPAWSGRAGDEIGASALAPGTPRFTAITSGIDGTGTAGQIDYLLQADPDNMPASEFIVEHRLSGATEWAAEQIPVANGGGSLTVYATGDLVEIRATSVSAAGVESAPTAIITIEVGGDDAAIPTELDAEAISITTLLGGVLIQLATGPDTATTAIQIYRSLSSTLDREADAVGEPYAVSPMQSVSFTIGDTNRSNLVTDTGFDDETAWTADEGWTVQGGAAVHAAGLTGDIGQAFSAQSGKFYRISLTVSDLVAGSLTAGLTGGSDRLTDAITADGAYAFRLQAVTGNDQLILRADTGFDGQVLDLTAYLETDACLDIGTHYIWLEPLNDDLVPGAVSGPFVVEIV
ncbi:host specificity factor TipJ family phage tail protein (plasmid) [Thioclava sp. 'Guangxiensis']|uniref:host specificity factor TipJ family phage tail protein n=1 Tax=Thioclava sp. 'Guangxiensis' TaxID=3149044 RepID=UPI0032C4AD1D